MKKTKVYKLSKKFVLTIYVNKLELRVENHVFTASYPFIKPTGTNTLLDVDESLFDLMMHLLLYNLEKINISPVPYVATGTKKILCYSGGIDSTAVLSVENSLPIHITRINRDEYENRQIKAVREVSSCEVFTDFEKVRMVYGLKHGFNVGIGYACMFFPVLPFFAANEIQFGLTWSCGFWAGIPYRYNASFENSATVKTNEILKDFKIKIVNPVAGYSEFLTYELARKSGIKNYSSCHTYGDGPSCFNCFKCLRKAGFAGKRIEFTPSFLAAMFTMLMKKPLKMAPDLVFGIQKAKYTEEYMQRYFDVDVSFCERVNFAAQTQLGNSKIVDGYHYQNKTDMDNIKKFVDFINNDNLYVF